MPPVKRIVGKRLELTGKVFTRFTVIEFLEMTKQGSLWKCRCSCGKEKSIIGKQLMSGAIKSCGCYKDQNTKERSIIHNRTKTVEYRTWRHIKSRCYNKNVHNYDNYGGRGIKICDRWLNSFENFYADMGERPSSNHSIDRFPNKDGDYELSNCRWATTKQQSRNIRTNHWIEHNGVIKILSDWAADLNTTASNLNSHLKNKQFPEVLNYFKNK